MKRPSRRSAIARVWHLSVLWGGTREPEPVKVIVVYMTPGGVPVAGPQAVPLPGAVRKALPPGTAGTGPL